MNIQEKKEEINRNEVDTVRYRYIDRKAKTDSWRKYNSRTAKEQETEQILHAR